MSKLGFTFYPQDWWTSDSFFDLTPDERYIYLEIIFLMYQNDGYLKTQKTQFENRMNLKVTDKKWSKILSGFIQDANGYTHPSINKRLRKTLANRENGKKGGRPKKEEINPNNPVINPPLEVKVKENIIYKEYSFFDNDFLTVWKDYLSMRKKIRKPATETAEKLALNQLSGMTNNNKIVAIDIVNQSIMNSWQGLFELKKNGHANTSDRNWK